MSVVRTVYWNGEPVGEADDMKEAFKRCNAAGAGLDLDSPFKTLRTVVESIKWFWLADRTLPHPDADRVLLTIGA